MVKIPRTRFFPLLIAVDRSKMAIFYCPSCV